MLGCGIVVSWDDDDKGWVVMGRVCRILVGGLLSRTLVGVSKGGIVGMLVLEKSFFASWWNGRNGG